MIVQFKTYIPEQLIAELLTLYLEESEESPTKKAFMEYLRLQVTSFGTEHAGLGENGWSCYEDQKEPIEKYFKKWFSDKDWSAVEFY